MTGANPALSPGRISTLPARAAAGSPRRVLSGIAWRRRYQQSLRVTDTLLILLVVLVCGRLFTGTALEDEGLKITFGLILGCAGGWLSAMYLFRTRDPRLIGVGAAEYKKVLHAGTATFGALAVSVVVLDIEHFRRFLVLTFAAGVVLLVASRWLWRLWLNEQRRYGHFLSKVVVVGRRHDVDYVAGQLARKSGPVYDVVGAVLECKGSHSSIRVGDKLVPAVCGLGNVEDFVVHTGADAVIVAGHLRKGTRYIRELGWRLERTSTELVLASSLTNVAGPRIRMRPVEGLPLMHVELPQFTGGRHVIKRAMDICLSALALLALAPLFLLLAVLIRLDSPGPVFFAQDRAGRGSELFRMYKFRSMVTSAEADLEKLRQLNEGNGVLFKIKDDPRVTDVGRWIRKYSLDELPQFYNVLKGDMSLVGPRPPLPSEVSSYHGHAHRRLFIKPGLTGLWQISGRSDLDWDESIRLDLYYVENWSVTGDLLVMWRTFKVVFRPVGAY
jgi:exopolysaccharide biosynthesis polyprenyl glycosylphosphotransferase